MKTNSNLFHWTVPLIIPLCFLGFNFLYRSFLMSFGIQDCNYHLDEFFNKVGALSFILITVLIGPILEELAFRLPLRISRFNVVAGTSIFVFLISMSLFKSIWISLPAAMCMAFLLNMLVNREPTFSNIELFAKRYRWFIISLSSMVFALLHVPNYSGCSVVIRLIYCVPLLFIGLVLGTVRIRFGFISALAAHSLYNAIVSLAFLHLNNVI